MYAIWLPFLGGTLDSIDENLLADDRVRQYWDGQATASRWFGRHLPNASGFFWDGYVVYGPKARWDRELAPLVRAGSTVIGDSPALEAAIRSLLGAPDAS